MLFSQRKYLAILLLITFPVILIFLLSYFTKRQNVRQLAAGTGYPASDGNILWTGDWETGDTSQWSVLAGGHWGNSSVSVVTAPVRQGKYAGKLTLNPTSGGGDVRAELESTQQETGGYPGQDWYYSWSSYFPSNPDKTTGWGPWNLFAQWMDMRHNCSPPLQLNVISGSPDYIDINQEINSQQSGNCSNSINKSWKLVNLVYDQWIDFTVHIKWSQDPTIGYVQVWVNGTEALPLTHMQTLDPGSTGVYYQQDMYRPNPSGTDIVYMDATRRHDAFTPGSTLTPISSITPPVSSSPTSNGTAVNLAIGFHGIGAGGDNVNPNGTGNSSPKHTTRNITISVFDLQNRQVQQSQGTLNYNSNTGLFENTVSLGSLSTGDYLLKIQSSDFLVEQFPQVIHITQGQNISPPRVFLINGDVNNDNKLDLQDYSALVDCFGSKQGTSKCKYPPTTLTSGADMDDDGSVGGSDYNLFLREISVQRGDGGPTPTPNPSSTLIPSPTPTINLNGLKHYEYVANDGSISVYDMDNNFSLVKNISLPQTTNGIRGIVGHTGNHVLYISHGSDSSCCGSLLKLDLLTDQVIWDKKYSHGIDSPAVSPDGTKLYQPAGELVSNGIWYVVDANNGNDLGTINGPTAPHNTIVSLNGQHVYMGGRQFNYLEVADTSNNQVIKKIGPLQNSVRPFTITGKETFAFTTATSFLGFQVSDINAQKVLYTIDLTKLGFPYNPSSFPATTPSHGIALSPDEKNIAVIDVANSYIHIFDVSNLPSSTPQKIHDIKFTRTGIHNESPCAYDCLADGWLEWSRDGRFIFIGDEGDVIDTSSWKSVANLNTLYNTRKMLEVDFQNGNVSYVPINRASTGFITQ